MAEGFARRLAEILKINIQVYSAGSEPAKEINPLAIEVMREKGIDITSQRPNAAKLTTQEGKLCLA